MIAADTLTGVVETAALEPLCPLDRVSYFTRFTHPSSHAAVTYIAKHSSAKGMNPR